MKRLLMSSAASSTVFPRPLRLTTQKLRSLSGGSGHSRAKQTNVGLFSHRMDRTLSMRWRGVVQLDMRKRDLKNQESVRLWKQLICLRLTKYELDESCRGETSSDRSCRLALRVICSCSLLDSLFKNFENMHKLIDLEDDAFPECMDLATEVVEENIRMRHLTMVILFALPKMVAIDNRTCRAGPGRGKQSKMDCGPKSRVGYERNRMTILPSSLQALFCTTEATRCMSGHGRAGVEQGSCRVPNRAIHRGIV